MTHPFRPYAPRPVRFRSIEQPNGYRIKRYDIVFAEPFREADLAEGVRLAFESLPIPPVTTGRPGVGFMIAHQGNGADYVVLGWWDRENELPLKVFVRQQSPGATWRPARESESVCVWDLEVIWLERQAYVQTVLGGGDVEGYLTIRASGAA